jgi:hypothetical protein
MKDKRKVLRPLGSGFAMAVPLFIGILVQDPLISSVGAMGAFSYLAFQHRSLFYNLRAILTHGAALLLAFILGAGTALIPWSAPFIIGALSFSAFLLSKVMRIPKPDYFFVLMLYATGFNFHAAHLGEILHHSSYLLYGIAGSLLAGLVISLAEQLPLKEEKNGFSTTELAREIFAGIISATRNGHQSTALFFDIVYCDLHCLSVAGQQRVLDLDFRCCRIGRGTYGKNQKSHDRQGTGRNRRAAAGFLIDVLAYAP